MEIYKGLSLNEVEISGNKFGTNIISEKDKVSVWTKFWLNFNNPIITILLVCLGIDIIFTFLGKVDWYECVGILTSVLIATFVSTLSEYKNENTFKKLQEEAAKTICKVYRDGELSEVSIEEIVTDDIVLLQPGDLIPADGYIIHGKIKVDQSPLNGESKEVEKEGDNDISLSGNTDFWDKKSVFRGSVVSDGQGVMKVTLVGDSTLYGKMTQETQINEHQSPLNIKLSKLAKDISKLGYIGAFLLFVMYMLQKGFINNNMNPVLVQQYFSDIPQLASDIVEAVILSITILVVAVPDGLPLMIAIVCSLNMRKMLKNNVLVRKIIGIETAGSINILFTDKTGTLTEGKLRVTNIVDGDNILYDGISKMPEKLKKMMFISIINNSGASVSQGKIIGGNITEKALLEHIKSVNNNFNIHKISSLPFSSKNKYSATEVSGEYTGLLIKGAPEIILSRCNRYFDKDGNVKFFNGKSVIESRINSFAQKSERVIAFAIKDSKMSSDVPGDLIFLSVVSIKDEIRRNVKKAVDDVTRAGIKVVMLTGDRKETAEAIAKDCGILKTKNDIVLTSADLHKMNDDEIKEKLKDISIIARAHPDDKSRLVRLAQECGMVVGMTGDGVNDAPALKSADVGFSMGSGTDVAKESGDIVILDDNFSSIKKAVLYGRTIYKSIKKFITFQLTINIAAVSVSIISFFFGITKPLSISQMLWVNLLMDTLAAIAFGGEAALNKYLLEKPTKREEAILDRKMWNTIITGGCFIAFISIIMFLSSDIHSLFRPHNNDIFFFTGYFSFFVFTCIFNAFNVRAEGIDLLENLSGNKQFISVMGLVALIQIIMTYFGGSFLRTAGLNIKEWIIVVCLSFLIIPIDIIRKLISK